MGKRDKQDPAVVNLVVVSDIHAGCRLALLPPEGIELDDGGHYSPSDLQLKTWAMWREFWHEWVPLVTRGEPFAVCVNGDSMDGNHHNATTQISHNPVDQKRIAKAILEPIVQMCEGRFYMVRGTEAHVGQSAHAEEDLAEDLGAIPDEHGNHARYCLWARLGKRLVHIAHHIGTTGSMAYETTALTKELADLCADAGRWGKEAPDVVVRSHRHRFAQSTLPSRNGNCTCVTTPGWQLKTPFAHKIPGGRTTEPQMGGILVRAGDEDVIYTRHMVWELDRPREVAI